MEQAHEMLLKHHEKTQELEYRQQKSVHNLREEQIAKQHATELQNQRDYTERAEKELLRKHAAEVKQQPKSLKVCYISAYQNQIVYGMSMINGKKNRNKQTFNLIHSKKSYKFVNSFAKRAKLKLDNIKH